MYSHFNLSEIFHCDDGKLLSPSVIAVDIFDKSNFTGARIPRFHEIKEDYPKDLESAVVFPDTLFRPSERKGKTLLLLFGEQLWPAPSECDWSSGSRVVLGWEQGASLHKWTLFRDGAAVHTSEAFCLPAVMEAWGAVGLAVPVCQVSLAAPSKPCQSRRNALPLFPPG